MSISSLKLTHPTFRATLIGSLAILFWGTTIPTSKFVAKELGQFTTVGTCLFLGGIVFRIIFGKPRKIEYPKLYALRFGLYFLYFICLHSAVAATSLDALPVILLANYLWPIATVLWSKFFKGSQVTKKLWLSLGLVLIALILEKGGSQLLNAPKPEGIWFFSAIIAALLWGAYSALNQQFNTRWGDISNLYLMALISGITFLLIGFLRNEPQSFSTCRLEYFFFYLSGTFAGQYLWDYGTRYGNIIILGFVADLTPWISLFTASFLFGAPIPITVYGAAALVLSAAWIARKE